MSAPTPTTAALTEARLRLFRFATAEKAPRYLAILRAFETARERSALQLGPAQVADALGEGETDEAVAADLDQLHAWGVLDRHQDDSRVRTIAEYRRRRAIYAMTELGWIAWSAVEGVLRATPGEAELQQLTLPSVLEELEALAAAVRAGDGERASNVLNRLHLVLRDLAEHAARFAIATSALASEAESAPEAFLAHKGRLFTHLNGFLQALTLWRPQLAAATEAVRALGVDPLVALVAPHRGGLTDEAETRARVRLHWEGVERWFVGLQDAEPHATRLEAQMTRAIRNLAGLLERVHDTRSGGFSRATALVDLAEWVLNTPDDGLAHALMSAALSTRGARHFAVPEPDPEHTPASASWWEAPAAPVDTTLRKTGKPTPSAPIQPVPDRSKEAAVLRLRQQQRRAAEEAAGQRIVDALGEGRRLDAAELSALLRLLSRALHTRVASGKAVDTVLGRVRLRLTPSPTTTARVATVQGDLLIPGFKLEVRPSTAGGPSGPGEAP